MDGTANFVSVSILEVVTDDSEVLFSFFAEAEIDFGHRFTSLGVDADVRLW